MPKTDVELRVPKDLRSGSPAANQRDHIGGRADVSNGVRIHRKGRDRAAWHEFDRCRRRIPRLLVVDVRERKDDRDMACPQSSGPTHCRAVL